MPRPSKPPKNVCYWRSRTWAARPARLGASFSTISRIASPEMFPEAEMLPHLICSRPILIGGANDEADQHGGAWRGGGSGSRTGCGGGSGGAGADTGRVCGGEKGGPPTRHAFYWGWGGGT